MAAEDDFDIPDSGAVFTFGKSKFGDSAPNKFWIRDDQVVQVACGDEHTALVSASGKLFTFGSNDWGQLGLGHNKITNKPSRVKALKNEKISLVTCGRTHTLVATESGKLFSFGNNGEGQLGISNTDGQNQSKPIQVKGLQAERIAMLSAGNDQSVALTEDGDVFVWGGNDLGQCGLEDENEITTPTKLAFSEKVTCISCGYYHTAFVTESGKLLTCGEAEDDKLGIVTDDECVKTPQEVRGIHGKVIHVACGGKHTIAITDSGAGFTFGEGSSGQLGLGTKIQKATTPVELTTVTEKLKLASCGENHTAVVSKNGSLYTFGDGRHGKLALGEENFANQFRPTHVSRFDNFTVEQVSCGGCHMLVSAKKGMTNGHIMNGQHSPAEDEVDSPPVGPLPQKRMSQMDHLRESMDLEGSIGARNRRREKLPDPSSSFTGRVLPPLNSSFTSSGKQSLAPLGSTQPPMVTQSYDSGLHGQERPVNRTLAMPVSSAPPPPAEEKEKTKMATTKEEEEVDSSDVSVTESEDEDQPKEAHNLKGKDPKAKPRPVPRSQQQESVSGDEEENESKSDLSKDMEEVTKETAEKHEPMETAENGRPIAPSRLKAVSYEDQRPQPVRRQLVPLQAKGKKPVESEEDSEELSEEEKPKKKGKDTKDAKKKEKDKKAKPPPKKKSTVGVFGKKLESDEEDDSEEDSEEELKEKKEKYTKKKKTFYNDSEEEEDSEEEGESEDDKEPPKSKKELEKERKEKERKEKERLKKEEKERKEKEKQAEKEKKEKEKKKKEKEAQKKKAAAAKASDKKKKASAEESEEDSEEEEDSLEEVTEDEGETDSTKTEKDDKKEKDAKEDKKEDKTPAAKATPPKKSSACVIL